MNNKIVRKILSVVLICIITFIGCKPQSATNSTVMVPISDETQEIEEDFPEVMLDSDGNVLFSSMSDEKLLDYIETDLYDKIIDELNSEDYLVESITAKYISQEYIDELSYNSKSNIYFGYSLEELNNEFQGTRYVFTLGENGETVVEEFQEYDDTYEQIAKNVAIGTGVILVCVVVSVATGGTADAVAVIFAAAAKTGAAVALSDGVLSGVVCGVVEGISSGDVKEGIKAGALEGSKSFKWGAITGCITGGATKYFSLCKMTLNGLTMNEAAFLQKTEKVPESLLKQLKSPEEYYELVERSKNGGIAIEELAKICKETDCPFELAKQLKSVEEYKEIVKNAENGGIAVKELANILKNTDCPLDLAKRLNSIDDYYVIAKNADNGGIAVKELTEIIKNTDCPLDLAKRLNSIDDYYEIVKNAENGGMTIEELTSFCNKTDCPIDLAKQLKSADEYYELVDKAKDGGLTIAEISNMCRETKYPIEIVKLIKTQAEKSIYFDQAELYSKVVDGKISLVRDIKLDYKVPGEELTNLERMLIGQAPIDPVSGKVYELHHVGQSVDSPLAILTYGEHHLNGNYKILHDTSIANGSGVHSLISDAEWAAQKKAFWKAYAEMVKP